MKAKTHIAILGLVSATFMAAYPARATDYTSDFPVSGNVYWNDTNKWIPNTGYPGMDVSDTVDVSNSLNNRMLYINMDDLHIAEFTYNTNSSATLILRAYDAARTITFDSLVKDSTSGNLMIIDQNATNTLSLYVGNLEMNGGQIEFGGSDGILLEKFTVTGSSTSAANTLILNASGKKIELGNLNLSASDAIARTSVRGRDGIIEVSSLTGSGVIEVNNVAGTVRGDLILNNTNASPATFSGRLRDNIGGVLHLTKQGSGTQILSGTNTFTGAVQVLGGTLNLKTTGGSALGSTASLSVSSGGTLLISKSDQVNNSAGVTLSGGTIKRESGVSEAFGNLTLTAASFLDYDSGTAGTLTFGAYTPSSLLTVNNFFEGNKLVFSSNIGSDINNTNYFKFNNSFATNWNGSTFTITAIPEPTAYATAIGLISLMLWLRAIRFRRLVFASAQKQKGSHF